MNKLEKSRELPFLRYIDKNKVDQYKDYFSTAPDWLIESLRLEQYERDFVFVRENLPVENVYFVVKGSIEAVDYRFQGVVYEFMRFDKIYAMGGMEYIMGKDDYGTTLRTVTKCNVIKLSKKDFARWMDNDIIALKKEAQRVSEYLFEDARNGRAFLFLNGEERIAMVLSERFEKYSKNGVLQVKGGRQRLANATGICLKTVQRGLNKLIDSGCITQNGTRLSVDEEQYKMLKTMVSKQVDVE